MNPIVIGAAAGLVLAVVALVFGVWGLLLAVVFGAIGALVGGLVSGRISARALGDVLRGRRSL
ncbi:MAG: DUF2273 domain-containing protein [Microcella sp.]